MLKRTGEADKEPEEKNQGGTGANLWRIRREEDLKSKFNLQRAGSEILSIYPETIPCATQGALLVSNKILARVRELHIKQQDGPQSIIQEIH